MAEDLIFYTHPMSRGRIVRWMLEETGCRYRTEVIEYGAMKDGPFLTVNPMGKVPAIRHKGVVVTEAAAICAYLADAFPEAGLAPPAADPLRGPYYRWLFFGAGPVEAAVTDKALGVSVPADRSRMIGYGSFEKMLSVLESAVSQGTYILGDRFSAADVYVGSQIGFGMRFGTIEKRPALEQYWARLSTRPALLRAEEMDNALMTPEQRALMAR